MNDCVYDVCPYCNRLVDVATFPWLFARHTVSGLVGSVICVGSRNIYTLDLLGLREIEPQHVPPRRAA